MSVLIRNKPEAPDLLSDSQPILKQNNNAIDTSFGLDHYAASSASPKNGMHNVVRTPAYTDYVSTVNPSLTPPVTAADIPAFYAFQNINGSFVPTNNIGVLQFSRGGSDAVPTPVTFLQSPSAGITLAVNSTTDILDFTGAPYCTGTVTSSGIRDVSFGVNRPTVSVGQFFWTGSQMVFYSTGEATIS